jgi:SAM-dependent methyltransferase
LLQEMILPDYIVPARKSVLKKEVWNMLFDWKEDTIRWFVDASEFTGYHRKLSHRIAPMIENYSTLCDIGCGLGILDLHLSPFIKKINCFDINEKALAYLKGAINKNNLTNIEVQQKNCESLSDFYDCILLSFFGSRNIHKYLPHCKKLIVIIGGDNTSHMYPTNSNSKIPKDRNTYKEVEKYLKVSGIPYNLDTLFLDFGQPFVSLEDARKYVGNLSGNATEEDIEGFIQRNIKKLNGDFPYYMAHEKEVGIFEIKGGVI